MRQTNKIVASIIYLSTPVLIHKQKRLKIIIKAIKIIITRIQVSLRSTNLSIMAVVEMFLNISQNLKKNPQIPEPVTPRTVSAVNIAKSSIKV